MTPPPTDERKTWWLLCYGVTSMEKTESTCQQLLQICDSNLHPLFLPLAVAAHAFYSRPFKNSRGVGFLQKDIVPDGSKGVHEWLIDFRDGVFSHTDATISAVAGRPLHDVVYSNGAGDQIFSTSDPLPRPEAYRDVIAHCARLRAVFTERIHALHDTYNALLPKEEGHFMLCLDADSPLFVSYTVKEHSPILHYK